MGITPGDTYFILYGLRAHKRETRGVMQNGQTTPEAVFLYCERGSLSVV